MYRCKECGCEYEVKPDFCDCGNDEFEEFAAQKAEVPQKTEPVIIPAKQAEKVKIKTEIKPKKSFSQRYPEISRFMSSIDPISGLIFLVCVFLSVYVIFFVWNIEDTEVKNVAEVRDTKIAKNIPAIDSFWNNATPKVEVKTEPKKEEQKEENIIQKIATPIVNKKPVQTTVKVNKTPQTAAIKPAAKTNVSRTTKTQTQKSQTQKTVTNTTTQKPKTTQPTAVQPAAQPTVQPATVTKSQKTAAEIAAEEAAKKAAEAQKSAKLKQEFVNYKAGLRNTIGRKIDFTRVVGDGNCTVAFKIDSTGKLVNRYFAKQSLNITLNDAVYAAVMSTPKYNPPPEGYKNEILNLNI
ncbi:TonB C-terminal domain-containing protein, partial [bacterium]|nr:TonB C-terminal domain-containing protein [bacterium]